MQKLVEASRNQSVEQGKLVRVVVIEGSAVDRGGVRDVLDGDVFEFAGLHELAQGSLKELAGAADTRVAHFAIGDGSFFHRIFEYIRRKLNPYPTNVV